MQLAGTNHDQLKKNEDWAHDLKNTKLNKFQARIWSHLTKFKLALLIKLVTEEKFEDKQQACNGKL